MTEILKSPGKYVQGAGVLASLDQYLQGMGTRLLILISPHGMKRMEKSLRACFDGKPYALTYALFEGECSQPQIDRLTDRAASAAAPPWWASAAARSWTPPRRWPMGWGSPR